MLFEDELPPTSREEAHARRIRPAEERFDPDTLSHWSITMTIAWIVWGDLSQVRKQWDVFRQECADWVFHTDRAALAEVGRIALHNLETGTVEPNNPDLDCRLKQGEWRLTSWGPASWHALEMRIRAKDMPPDHFLDPLWLAAGEGKIQASGLECNGEKDFQGRLVEIPQYLWSRLRRGKEPSGKAMLVSPDRVYRDVEFARLDVKKLWPFRTDKDEPDFARSHVESEISRAAADVVRETTEATVVEPELRSPRPRIAEREIEPTFQKWRAQQPAGYMPTATQDIAYMKTHGVSRERVRKLIQKFGGRKRGEKLE